MNNIPKIGREPYEAARLSTDQSLRVAAFLIVVLPTALAANVLLWNLALWIGRQ